MESTRVKRILLIVDGLGDLPVPALDNQTPLEAASTPNLNHFASQGEVGLVDPISPGVIPNTDTGTSLLMGLDPDDAHLLSRGPIEAAGAGFPLKPGEVALRANFATGKPDGTGFLISDRRAGRTTKGLTQLATEISNLDLGDGIRAKFHPTDQHRGVVVLSGDGLDAAVTDTDPGDASLPALLAESRPLSEKAKLTARKVNRFIEVVQEKLAAHAVNVEREKAGLLPANCLITRGAGSRSELRNLFVREGYHVALVAGCNTVLGLGSQFDFQLVTDDKFTADTQSDYEAKIQAAMDASGEFDLVIIHIKAPDTCAHDLNPAGKMKVIERLDSALEPLRRWQGVLALSADHTTDSNSGRHTKDPVPSMLVHLPGVKVNDPAGFNFGEELCRQGSLERQNSRSFIARFLGL